MRFIRWFASCAGAVSASLAIATLALSGNHATAQAPGAEDIELHNRPITHFRIGSDETRFGPLEFIGGFSVSSDMSEFGQLSAMRFLSPGGDFMGVADHGYWFFGEIERNADGVPVGFADFRMQAMVDDEGQAIGEKPLIDAEGLDVHDGIATVSFEREHRVSEYRLDAAGMGGPIRDLDYVVPRRELRFNAGLETVVRMGPDGIHDGARLVIAERSIDTEGNLFAAIIDGPEQGIFKIVRSGDFDATDGALLPDGDLLLLERRFSPLRGVAMRLRRISAEAIREGALVDGPVLFEADMTYQIDNMEALDVWRRADGATMVSLLSDDNQSFLQRTLYLEFRLVE